MGSIDTWNVREVSVHSRLLAIIFLTIFTFGACDCGEELSRLCPPSKDLHTCMITDEESGEYRTTNASQVAWRVEGDVPCRLGQETCDPDTLEITCEGYVPQSDEICDTVDNDCDGDMNEGTMIGWSEGENDCEEQLHGVCAKANKVCNLVGEYECVPVTGPSVEICNGEDDDCDGVPDNNIAPTACWTGPASAIRDDGTTPCKGGERFCEEGSWSQCRNQILPEEEFCGDEIDNDCDGEVDTDIVHTECGPESTFGQCRKGNDYCINGEKTCVDAEYATAEECDNIDNDCNGYIDEDSTSISGQLERLCVTTCGVGIEYCNQGGWIGCTAPQPSVEICDGFDNDCNGQIDEGCPCIHGDTQTCINGMVDADGNPATCGVGIQICEFGQWAQCELWGTFPEECNNWDDDCDGTVDGISVECGPEEGNEGECNIGTDTCSEGQWVGCEDAVYPEEEICDNKDNDCDGDVDEGIEPDAKVDMVFAVDTSGSMCNKIDALRSGIANYVTDFEDTEHLFGLVIFPTSGNGYNGTTFVVTQPALVNVSTLVTALNSLTCNYIGTEASYDTLLYLSDPSDPLQIGWRSDATPYIVLITDEQPQTLIETNVVESDISPYTTNCQIGNCSIGDRIEVFIITLGSLFFEYDSILYGEAERFFDIYPASEDRYSDILRDIFANVCAY